MCVKETLGQVKYAFSIRGGFFCANVHFEAKPSEVIKKEGDPFFDVGPGFRNKCTIVYIEHAEYTK